MGAGRCRFALTLIETATRIVLAFPQPRLSSLDAKPTPPAVTTNEKTMRETITKIVYDALAEANKGLGLPELQTPDLETRLYGAKSALDSISLVTLIADIEERVSADFGKDIVLADERAMNQRLSPFGRVGTLVDYIEKLLGETE